MDAKLYHRLGPYAMWALATSTAALFAVVIFLQFIWFGTEADPRWRDFVSQDWRLPTAVTLSTMVVRGAVAAQTATAVSLVASVLLESHVKLSRVPEVSLMRFASPGSWVAGWVMCESAVANPLAGTLGVLLLLVSFGLQFSSTALLADFAIVPALTVDATTQLNVSYGQEMALVGNEYIRSGSIWSSAPSRFPAFAEHTDPTYAQFSDEIHDTGVSIRGFLPVRDQDQRERMSEYNGYITMTDTRVACVRPDLEEVRLVPTEVATLELDSSSFRFVHFQGQVSTKKSVPLLNITILEHAAGFRCMANNFQTPEMMWFGMDSFTLCPLDIALGGLVSPLTSNETGGLAYLLLDHTNTVLGVENATETWSTSPDGIWTNLRAPAGFPNGPAQVRATLCYDARSFYNTTRLVKATSSKRRVEPELSIILQTGNGSKTSYDGEMIASFDTGPVRSQLGASRTRQSTAQRGVLDLSLDLNYADQRLEVDGSSSLIMDSMMQYMAIRPLHAINAITLCTACISSGAEAPGMNYAVDETLRAVFFDALHDTGSPAVALQALFTVVSHMAYQRLMPYFYVPGIGRITVQRELNIPVSKRGLGIVVGLLLVQCILTAASLVLFARRTRHTRLADSWQVMAHTLELDNRGGAGGVTSPQPPVSRGNEIERVLTRRATKNEDWHLTSAARQREDNAEEGSFTDMTVVAIRRRLETTSPSEKTKP